MFIVSCFIAVSLKDGLVSAPRKWRDDSAEKCRSCVQDYAHRLVNSAFVGVTRLIYSMFNVLAVYAPCDSCGIVSCSNEKPVQCIHFTKAVGHLS